MRNITNFLDKVKFQYYPSDSYGSEYVSSIQFVEPKVKSVTDYQPIK